MPRIYTSANDPLDFCAQCFVAEQEADEMYGDVGQGPDGRQNCFEYDADHPGYEDTGYCCAACGKLLEASDDFL